MPLRNRLISLIYRGVLLGLTLYTLVLLFIYDRVPNEPMHSFVYFGTEAMMFASIILLLEFIFNFVDFLKHGIHGAPACVWMPLTLAMVSFLVADALCYNITAPILNGYKDISNLTMTILSHAVVPFLVLLDYLLFDEKGTVKWKHGAYWLLFPVFYFAFTMAGHYIWNSSFYPYPFLNNEKFLSKGDFLAGSNGWNGVLLTIALLAVGFAATGFIFILLNNILAGKYKRH